MTPNAKKPYRLSSPNKKLKSKDMPEYIVSIREVEKVTGLDFLSSLPEEEQDRVETARQKEIW